MTYTLELVTYEECFEYILISIIILFADDHKIIEESENNLIKYICKLNILFEKHNLTIPLQKTKLMAFLRKCTFKSKVINVRSLKKEKIKEKQYSQYCQGPFINYVRIPREGGWIISTCSYIGEHLRNIFQVDILEIARSSGLAGIISFASGR